MKRLFLGTLLLGLVMTAPVPATAGFGISFEFPLPPPIIFPAPPDVIVIPGTNDVYVVPDADVDVFFWDGWWWRPWDGGWYRSHYYDRDWAYYGDPPDFYYDVDPDWRRYYRERNWSGHQWNYKRIPQKRFKKSWKRWKNDRYWERRGTWGVQKYQVPPRHQRHELRQKRQQQYQQRPEVRKHRQLRDRGGDSDRRDKDGRDEDGRDGDRRHRGR